MKTEELISEARSLPKVMREDFLRNHSTNVVIGQYFKRYDSEDLSVQQQELAGRSIELALLEEEFESIRNEWKAKIKAKREEFRNVLTVLKQNGEWQEGEQFMFSDQKRGIMEYYDVNADFIQSRRLLPEERQLNVFDNIRDGLITKSEKIGE